VQPELLQPRRYRDYCLRTRLLLPHANRMMVPAVSFPYSRLPNTWWGSVCLVPSKRLPFLPFSATSFLLPHLRPALSLIGPVSYTRLFSCAVPSYFFPFLLFSSSFSFLSYPSHSLLISQLLLALSLLFNCDTPNRVV